MVWPTAKAVALLCTELCKEGLGICSTPKSYFCNLKLEERVQSYFFNPKAIFELNFLSLKKLFLSYKFEPQFRPKK